MATAPKSDAHRWTAGTVCWEDVQGWAAEPRTGPKDGPGYVLGLLAECDCGRGAPHRARKAESVQTRSVVALDADTLTPAARDDLLRRLEATGWDAVVYSTHSSTAAAPRLRVLILPDRDVTPAEYRLLARTLMHRLGWDRFDRGSEQPERFMYMPTRPAAGDYEHHVLRGVPVPVGLVLLDEQLDPSAPCDAETAPPASSDGPVYADLSEPEQRHADALVQRRVDGLRVKLAAAADWPDGEKDDQGRGWERLLADTADTLAALAYSPWNALTLDQAEALYDEIVPEGMAADVPGKWAAKAHGDHARRGLPWEPLAGEFEALPDDEPEPQAPSTSGWDPVNLDRYLDGTYDPPQATLMRRSDGVCLVYPGKTHSIHGESESGKSMLVQAEAATLLRAGERVLYLDYEADPASVVERLLLMGTAPEQVRAGLVYLQPEVDYGNTAATREAFDRLMSQQYALAVVDGVTEALSQAPAKLRSTGGLGGNDDITVWHDRLPRLIARKTGAAVVMVDHVAKGPDAGRFAIGGQAKMATITGAAYTVRPVAPLGRGLVGEIEVYVAKDRHGYVRAHASQEYGKDRTQLAAVAVVDGSNGRIAVELTAPGSAAAGDKVSNAMRRISDFLVTLPSDHEGAGTNMIKTEVSGNNEVLMEALNRLVREGYVERQHKGQRKLHRHVRHYAPELTPVEEA